MGGRGARVLGSRSAVVRLQPLSLRTLWSCGASWVGLIAGFAVARSPAICVFTDRRELIILGPAGRRRLRPEHGARVLSVDAGEWIAVVGY